ncbi:hypothetical protein ACP4OV_018563 [Aristida adscensionis]
MAIAGGRRHPPPPLAGPPHPRLSAGARVALPPRRALLLALAFAVALAACPLPALAASGGAMGGRSYSSSSSGGSSSSKSSSSSYSYSSSSVSSSRYSSSRPWLYSSSSAAETARESVGTEAPPPPVDTAAERASLIRFWCYLAAAVGGAGALIVVVQHYTRPRTTVVKLQVALLGSAKSFQTDLNDIADKVEASSQRWYKFMLTETTCSLRRHRNCCISSSLSVDVKDKVDSWEQHFDKISIEERSKFDEETLYNLEGIKRKKAYSRKPDDFRNEYIVITILLAADGVLDFPEVRNNAGLEAVVEKLNSVPARRIQGIQILWTPQDENDVLSEAKLLEDYPHLKPLYDD